MTTPAPTSTKSALKAYALATLVLVGVAAFLARPSLLNCSTTILGAPGDATNGGVWTAYNYLKTGGPPWLQTTPFTAAPGGDPWWHAYYITSILVFGPIWFFTRLTSSATCGWNLAIYSGFVLSGLAMFALARHVCRHNTAALLAAFAYTISPYRQFKAEGHIAYVHTQLFPLLLLTGLLLWERPTKPRVLAAALVLALLGYTDGYYILLGSVAFAALHLSLTLWWLIGRQERAALRPRLLAVVAVGAMSLIALAPVLVTFLSTRSEIATTLSRGGDEVAAYSARPREYLTPARSHPIFSGIIGDWQDRNLHGSNYGESSLFLGWATFVGAGGCVISVIRSRRRSAKSSPDTPSGAMRAMAVWGLTGTAAVAFIFSLPPRISVGGVTVLMPSGVISSFVRFWRVYARFFIVVHPAVLALAATFAAAVLGHRRFHRPIVRTGFVLVLVTFLSFENLVTWSPGSWSYDLAPQAYRFVAEQNDVDTIAEWPLEPTSNEPDHRYLGYVPVHGKRLVNVLEDQSRPDQIARAIYGLNDPETVPVLRSLGTDLVLVHRSRAPAPVTTDQLELIASFSYAGDVLQNVKLRRLASRWSYLAPAHDVDVYRIKPGPEPEAVLAIGKGFYDPETSPTGTSSRWMQQDGEIRVIPADDSEGPSRVSLALGSLDDVARKVTIRQGRRVVWSGTIAQARQIEFNVPAGPGLRIHASPGPVDVPGDPRRLSVNLSNLDIIEGPSSEP